MTFLFYEFVLDFSFFYFTVEESVTIEFETDIEWIIDYIDLESTASQALIISITKQVTDKERHVAEKTQLIV